MRISSIPRVIGNVCSHAAGLALLTIFVVNVTQVLLRTLGVGWVWVGDLSKLLMLWTVMMGAAAAYCRHEHIVGGFFGERLEGVAGQLFRLAIRLVEVAFFFLLAIAGARVTVARSSIDYVQLGLSSGWAYAAIPIGAALMLLAAMGLPLRHPVAHNEAEALDAEDAADTDTKEHV